MTMKRLLYEVYMSGAEEYVKLCLSRGLRQLLPGRELLGLGCCGQLLEGGRGQEYLLLLLMEEELLLRVLANHTSTPGVPLK